MLKRMQRSQKTVRRFLAGILCLMAYSACSSPALAELCALTATFDSSHSPRIEFRNAALTVVLTHTQDTGGGQLLHRHSAVSGLLCVLADRHSAGADHRLQFHRTECSERTDNTLKVVAAGPLGFVFECLSLVSKAAVPNAGNSASGIAASLLSTRSTVLLV